MNKRLLRACLIVLLVGAFAVPAEAFANTTSSSNWAGYVVHRRGLLFHTVAAKWRQPRASCSSQKSFAAFWVGLGGYAPKSKALEQAGTEVDCVGDGLVNYYAWFELVPSPPVKLPVTTLGVRPGDVISTRVTVDGNRVTLLIRNETQRQSFRKVRRARAIDGSSAEWIVEAPSGCFDLCGVLPLADFGSATFNQAQAQASGRVGSISNPFWQSTKLNLRPQGRSFISGRTLARPSGLHSAGRSFKVTYTPGRRSAVSGKRS